MIQPEALRISWAGCHATGLVFPPTDLSNCVGPQHGPQHRRSFVSWRSAQRSHRPDLSGVGEWSPAAWALTVVAVNQGRQRRGLRDGHNRFERQRGAVGVVAIDDTPDRVAPEMQKLGDPARKWLVFALPLVGRGRQGDAEMLALGLTRG
jgi:hypothetical protein